MLSKILCIWGLFSIILLGWEWLLAPLFGILLDEFFRQYILLTIALFSFALAVILFKNSD